jgi:molybdenum cofactor cytidylyltransferase
MGIDTGARTSRSLPRRTGGTGRRGPSAIVLAAGASSRFHGTKQLALIGGKTLVERVLDVIPAGELRETVVVLGHEAAAVSTAIGARKGVTVVVNAGYRAGMGTSISTGTLALAKGAEGAMILLADQPFVSRSLLRRMMKAFEARGSRGIVAAAQGDVVTPPAIFSSEYFPELSELRGDQGARLVIERHPSDVSLVRVRSRKTLADIDTRDEFEAARRLLEP